MGQAARSQDAVQMPTTISHGAFLTRSASVWGSRNSLTGVLTASSISLAVRWRMNTGLPRHLTVTIWPSWIRGDIDLDRRQSEGRGVGVHLIDKRPDDRADADRCASTAPVAKNRKSLRFWIDDCRAWTNEPPIFPGCSARRPGRAIARRRPSCARRASKRMFPSKASPQRPDGQNARAPSRIVCGYFAPFALVVHSPIAGSGAACRHGSRRARACPIAGLPRRRGRSRDLSLFRNWL